MQENLFVPSSGHVLSCLGSGLDNYLLTKYPTDNLLEASGMVKEEGCCDGIQED